METVTSRDGTRIAYERMGNGPALVLVDGALCYRNSGPMRPLAQLLATDFTVFLYDRRGRGDSADIRPYAVDREIEDLDAILKVAGGSAFVCGLSSGAALSLEAANHGLPIRKLVLYEAPFIVDATRTPVPADYVQQLDALIANDRRSDAVKSFMKIVGVPAIFIALMRVFPSWKKLTAVAHTLPYDIRIVLDQQQGRPLPPARWNRVTTPTLVALGGKSPAWMQNANRALARVIPGASERTLPGQTHMVSAKVLAPVLVEYFKASQAGT